MNIPNSYKEKPLIHAWNYYDAKGALVGIVGRYQGTEGKKEFVPYFKSNGSNWMPGIELNPRPLFGLNSLVKQPKEKAVFITEGEKAAAALQSIGLCAVSSLGGAQAGKLADWTPLSGYKCVFILPDNDEPGKGYAADVYRAVSAIDTPPQVKVLALSGLPPKGDAVDWLQSFVNDWDGYAPIDTLLHQGLKEELQAELKSAESIPEDWGLVGLAGSGVGAFDWEKPGEMTSKMPDVAALTDDLIPEPLRPWLSDVSHRMQTPGDFAAVSVITVIGSIIGAGCSIKPKRFDDFEVIPNVWGACIARPSVVLKSPSMNEATRLLDKLQAEYGEQHQEAQAGAEFDALANKAKLDDVKGQLAKVTKGKGKDGVVVGDDIDKLKADYLELTKEANAETTRRLFKTNETSIQSMTVLQNQNPRGLLVFRDELTALLVRWDSNDGADERAYFLEAWNGNGSYTDFKIGRGLTEAKSVCISLLGGIQPDKLRRYLHQAQNGANDGLMQRLQLAVWPDEPEHWQLIDTPPNKQHRREAFKIMQILAELDFIQCGAVQTEYDDRPYFRFSADAQEIFNTWLTELQTVKIKHEQNPLMVEHFGKFRSLMPSLALIFHCIELANGTAQGAVSVKAALLAVEWCDYLESHARRIYAMAESPEHEAAVRLANKIKSGAVSSPFTAKDVYRKHWHGLKDRAEVELACNVLIDEDWLRVQRKPKTKTGRPALPEYHINPFFL